ncbi:MAG: hypothetical protein KJ732_04740, partial [Candidatus Margulisbacteria bacterium]|nr:hypothetical protein [Candidatus Margulisiibacteriota bacterium]
MAFQTRPSHDLIDLKNEILAVLRGKERYIEQELEVLEQAFDIMLRFHGDEKLPNGEKITIHLLNVAKTLCEWGCSPLLAAAGLLHLVPIKELEEENINQYVIHLIKRKAAIGIYLFTPIGSDKLSAREARYLYKMCLMQEGNRDVWLLEAADQFKALTTLSEFGKRPGLLASRGYHVTSPILSGFDLDDIAVRLENIAFLRLDREEYERIEAKIEDTNKRTRIMALAHLRTLTDLVSDELRKGGIPHRAQFDVKSVTRTMKKINKGEELTDASRFRFIIDGTRKQCLEAMETIINAMEILDYTEDLRERKNYVNGISVGQPYDEGPKPNGYESLHLHFRGEHNEPINVQIRTEAMHEMAELGSASHGRFKLNGLMGVAFDVAQAERTKLLDEGRRYGLYKGNLYRLIPYQSGARIKLIDLLFAVSLDEGLRAPAKATIERINPVTGEIYEIMLPVSAPLENGDHILSLKKPRGLSTSRVRANQLGTLPALVAYALARAGKLDPELIKVRSSSAQKRGEAALGIRFTDWRNNQKNRLSSLLKGAGENITALTFGTTFSPLRAAKAIGMNSEAGMHLAIGLAGKRDELINQVMNVVRTSSTAVAFKVLSDDASYADLWLMVYDVPGTISSVINLLARQNLQLFHFSSRPLPGNYSLIKIRVKTR